jgi:hypothetical protein
LTFNVEERPRTSTPNAFQERGCWKIRWPRSPAVPLIRNDDVSARIAELTQELSAQMMTAEIGEYIC